MTGESRKEKTWDMNHKDQLLSISDYFMPPDPTSFDFLSDMMMLSSEFDVGDMTYGLKQEHVDFNEGVFPFEF